MVIYKISKFPFPSDTILSGFFLLVILVFLIESWKKYRKVKMFKYLLLNISMLFILLLVLNLFVISVSYGGSDEYKYARKYYAGDYQSVKGKVTELQTENINGNIWKKFYIKGELFEQKYFVLNWNEMFHKDKTIYTNGQIVEICYVEDEDEYYESGKVIVMITLLESE